MLRFIRAFFGGQAPMNVSDWQSVQDLL